MEHRSVHGVNRAQRDVIGQSRTGSPECVVDELCHGEYHRARVDTVPGRRPLPGSTTWDRFSFHNSDVNTRLPAHVTGRRQSGQACPNHHYSHVFYLTVQ